MVPHQLSVAVVGTGLIARDQHLPAWLKMAEVKVAAVADPSAQSLAAVYDQFGIDRRVGDYRELLDDKTIDVIDVCVPSGLHAEVTVAALSAGKHVLCEKPMATSRADAAAMLDAWRASGKKLMIGQHMRFEPSVRRLRAWLSRHPPGEIYYGRAQWLRRRRLPGRPGFTERKLSGGGALYDLGVHILDLAWWMMGCPAPTSVSGTAFQHLIRRTDIGSEWGQWNPQTIDVEDFAAGMVRFANGAALSLETSWLALQPETEFHRVQLYGTHAGILWPEGIIIGEEDQTPWDLKLEPVAGEKAQRQAIYEFARAVIDDLPVPIPPEQSATAIAMLEGIYASSVAGREVTVVPFQ
jgi:predicted dehydrogenase